ncbi:hypothetical protein [Nocardia sp. NPDC003963]
MLDVTGESDMSKIDSAPDALPIMRIGRWIGENADTERSYGSGGSSALQMILGQTLIQGNRSELSLMILVICKYLAGFITAQRYSM